ncbi:hypothetical protein BVRB_5g111070 [Beta vulgaris subsp. vulgaris]|nr:hypothetical protein BVRB_5g111070 [Beta vulgaris subsp. vulgaris]
MPFLSPPTFLLSTVLHDAVSVHDDASIFRDSTIVIPSSLKHILL